MPEVFAFPLGVVAVRQISEFMVVRLSSILRSNIDHFGHFVLNGLFCLLDQIVAWWINVASFGILVESILDFFDLVFLMLA